MKKMKVQLLLVLAVLVVLGGGLWYVTQYQPEGSGETPSSSSTATVTLLDKTTDQISSVSVKNDAGEFEIVKAGDQWTIAGYDAQYMNQSALLSCVPASISQAELIADRAENLADFGLDKPLAVITVAYEGGSLTLRLGAEAPGAAGYYAMVDNKNTPAVYLLSAGSYSGFSKAPLDFLGTAVTTGLEEAAQVSPEQGEAGFVPDTLTLGGTVRKEPLAMANQEQTEQQKQVGASAPYLLTSHNNRAVDSNFPATAAALFQITGSRAVAYEPDAAKLAELGLAEPYSTAKFTWTPSDGSAAKECTLLASPPTDGSVNLMREGVPVVYEVSTDQLPWLEVQYQDVISRLLVMPYINDMSEVRIQGGGKEETYRLTLTEDGKDVTVKDGSGAEIKVDMFKKLYQNLLSLPAEEYTDTRPQEGAKTLLTVTYVYREGGKQEQIQMIEGPSVQAFLSYNGETEFLTKAKYADIILNGIDKVKNGEAPQDLY